MRQLEAIVRDQSLSTNDSVKQIVEGMADEPQEPDAFRSNIALRGGTHAPLAMVFAGLAQTERRTEEIKATVAECAAR